MKREKARQRAMTRVNNPIYLKLEADAISEVQDSDNGETKNKKKVLQMIRNRISAQTSRDRKKAYLYQLEEVKNKMSGDNNVLKQQNISLLQELSKLKQTNKKLLQQNEELRGKSDFDIIEIDHIDNNYTSANESKQVHLETIVKDMVNCSALRNCEAFTQDKDCLNDIYSFATILSTLVFNHLNNKHEKSKLINF